MTVARLVPVEPPFSPEVADALRRRMPRSSPVPPLSLFRLLVKDDALSAAMEPMGRFNLRHEPGRFSSIEPRDREVIIDRVCARCGCGYEWGVHVASYSEGVGLTPEQVVETAAPPGVERSALTDRDRLLVDLVDQLHDTADVDDDLWRRLGGRWSEAQLLQMLVLAGWYHVISYVANVARLPSETWAAPFPST